MGSGGPFRGMRSGKKRSTKHPHVLSGRSAEYSETLEEKNMKSEQQQQSTHALQQHMPTAGVSTQPPKKRTGLILTVVGVLTAVLFIGSIVWLVSQGGRTAIDKSRYQAIWLTNGQYYFGKLQMLNRDYVRLTDVFYLQDKTAGTNDETKQNTTENQNNLELVKLGNELHGPEDEMIVAKDQLLFYENLKTNGKVAQSIAQYKASGQ
jgi:hypothetical protein